jgi:hypothetical protein
MSSATPNSFGSLSFVYRFGDVDMDGTIPTRRPLVLLTGVAVELIEFYQPSLKHPLDLGGYV